MACSRENFTFLLLLFVFCIIPVTQLCKNCRGKVLRHSSNNLKLKTDSSVLTLNLHTPLNGIDCNIKAINLEVQYPTLDFMQGGETQIKMYIPENVLAVCLWFIQQCSQ